LLERRIKERIPVAYLLNEAWLHGVPFYVDRRVIIPRSHIAFLLNDLRVAPRRILDLCTGSGCLAILAARIFRNARVDASDVSSVALEVAAQNVRKHRFEKRIRLIRSDLFGSIRRRYDLIICNPPYVSTPSLRTLPREYRYEPGIALAGGKRGLDYVARIIDESPRFLKPGGLLVCEVGDTKPALERAYPRTPFAWPRPQVFMLAPSRRADASRRRPRRVRAT
jgi:ribosomal protein L3 glutamine methyltransferase